MKIARYVVQHGSEAWASYNSQLDNAGFDARKMALDTAHNYNGEVFEVYEDGSAKCIKSIK